MSTKPKKKQTKHHKTQKKHGKFKQKSTIETMENQRRIRTNTRQTDKHHKSQQNKNRKRSENLRPQAPLGRPQSCQPESAPPDSGPRGGSMPRRSAGGFVWRWRVAPGAYFVYFLNRKPGMFTAVVGRGWWLRACLIQTFISLRVYFEDMNQNRFAFTWQL